MIKNGGKLTKEEIKKIIITELPKLIKRDAQTRELIIRLAQEHFADKKQTEDRFEKLLQEIKVLREEGERRWRQALAEWNQRFEAIMAEWNIKWEETKAEWNKKWEENQRKWEENQKVINKILEEIKLLHRKHDTSLGALGARWGLRAESSFREAIKGILEESFPVKVIRYIGKDEEGIVFGRPDQIELDLIIKDGEVIVGEIKSSISKGDVATFLKKVEVYTKKEEKIVTRKILISPMIDNAAKEFAISEGIEVYGYPEEVDFKELQSEELSKS